MLNDRFAAKKPALAPTMAQCCPPSALWKIPSTAFEIQTSSGCAGSTVTIGRASEETTNGKIARHVAPPSSVRITLVAWPARAGSSVTAYNTCACAGSGVTDWIRVGHWVEKGFQFAPESSET